LCHTIQTAHDHARDREAILTGDPEWQPGAGVISGALLLDGVDDVITTGFILNPVDAALTVFLWVKGGAPGQVVVSQADGANWLLADATAGYLMTDLSLPAGGRLKPKPLVSESEIVDGRWHRIGVVWDGSTRSLYVDGVLVAEDLQPSIAGSLGGLYIGCGTDQSPSTFWSGLIDDVRIYNRAVRP
jgi:concanavalin A-like lectin/glucanase superfamily protein